MILVGRLRGWLRRRRSMAQQQAQFARVLERLDAVLDAAETSDDSEVSPAVLAEIEAKRRRVAERDL